jgi:hypothetical protein
MPDKAPLVHAHDSGIVALVDNLGSNVVLETGSKVARDGVDVEIEERMPIDQLVVMKLLDLMV